MDGSAIAALALATFVGALVQAVTGFGFAIIAAPVFLWAIASKAAVAVLVALHLVQSLMLVPAVAHQAPRWHLRRLLAGAAAGGPFGLWLLAVADLRSLKIALGLVILAVSALFLHRMRTPTRRAGGHASAGGRRAIATLATGAASGALTALLVMPGPPLMVYALNVQWPSAAALRALSLTFFAVCYLAVTLAHLALGALGGREWIAVGLLAPVVAAGTAAGHALVGRLDAEAFRLAILALLVLSGAGALASGLIG